MLFSSCKRSGFCKSISHILTHLLTVSGLLTHVPNHDPPVGIAVEADSRCGIGHLLFAGHAGNGRPLAEQPLVQGSTFHTVSEGF